MKTAARMIKETFLFSFIFFCFQLWVSLRTKSFLPNGATGTYLWTQKTGHFGRKSNGTVHFGFQLEEVPLTFRNSSSGFHSEETGNEINIKWIGHLHRSVRAHLFTSGGSPQFSKCFSPSDSWICGATGDNILPVSDRVMSRKIPRNSKSYFQPGEEYELFWSTIDAKLPNGYLER